MKIYNTLTRQIEEIKPIQSTLKVPKTEENLDEPSEKIKPHLGIYACGPTVYDYAHLGHLRKYSMDDVLIRMLRHDNFDVKFVQNITDVGHLTSDADEGEDKLEKGAKKYHQSVWDVARRFEDSFFASMDAMHNVRPDVSCRATDHIQGQIELVQKLEKHGHTYVISGDGVYFDVSTFADYGKMAQLHLADQLAGARVAVTGKRQPEDFALWKFERPGENRAMVWASPWAERGFPGWHVECSAMSIEHLGEQFELHTGGIDHIPVHHTNEIAQSEGATGKSPFVKYWVHHNFLRIEGEKMSKSLGNFFTVDDIKSRGFDPMALRLLFLNSHYRSELNFTWDNLAGSQKTWEKLMTTVKNLRQKSHATEDQSRGGLNQLNLAIPKALADLETTFFAHLANDLATSQAMAVFWELIKQPAISSTEAKALYRTVLECDQVLGLGLASLTEDAEPNSSDWLAKVPADQKESVQKIVEARQTAREQKDWLMADKLRLQLLSLGWVIEDGTAGEPKLKAS